MDVIEMLGYELPITPIPIPSLAHAATKQSPTDLLSESRTDMKSCSNDATPIENTKLSTDQQSTSPSVPTRHFPLRPQLSHRHSSIDSRGSTSPPQTVVIPTMKSAPAPAENLTSISTAPHCPHCGLLRVRSAFHPNEQTCHTPLQDELTPLQDELTPLHELTSHLGSESLGQNSKLPVEDVRSFD